MTTTHTIDVEAERVLFEAAFPMSLLFAESRPDNAILREKMEFAFQVWLAAKRSIQPAAPVLAAVGVEARQHSDVIPPSRAEPASQHGAIVAAIARGWLAATPECQHMNDEMIYAIATEVEKALAPVPRMGGNTIPEVPAAQPAADHAKRDGCCNNNCNQGRNCPERK